MGEHGPRAKDFNMRWIASLLADAYRVLRRGGAYLYPDDARPGYAQGRLRLLYEANPIAFLVEQAGGLAIGGVNRILDLPPKSLHARTPLIFGSTDKVERIRGYYVEEHRSAARAPLFAKRGLLR
jgi:fructose-1,6-bisphosphatase I